MKLKPKSISTDFINGGKDYAIIKCGGQITLVCGESGKGCRGMTFKDTAMLREVAGDLLVAALLMDKMAEGKISGDSLDADDLGVTTRLVRKEY